MKATRASSAVAFVVSVALAATSPAAFAGRRPHIVVEPVLSWLDDGRPTIRVSVANDSSEPIVIDPKTVEVFLAGPVPSRRKRPLTFQPMPRYPCSIMISNGVGPAYIVSSDGTTMVWSAPEPWPSPEPTPVETPMSVDPGASALSAPFMFGEIECNGGAFSHPNVWTVYATVTWYEPGSAKRSRIVSVVKRVDVPTTNARPVTKRGAAIEDGGAPNSNDPSRPPVRFRVFGGLT